MNEEIRKIIDSSIENLDNAIDLIESEDLSNNETYKTLSSVIEKLELLL